MEANRQRGFTLMELLVVVSIITLLTSILVPTVGRVREAGKRAYCQANLRSIGQAIRLYMDDHHGIYPPMAPMVTEENPIRPRPAISEILGPYVGNQSKVFECPSDRFIDSAVKPPHGVETWFAWQGSSYEPRMFLSEVTAGGEWNLSREYRFAERLRLLLGGMEDLSRISLIHDYEHFHGPKGESRSRMALYADFHVADFHDVGN